MSEFNIAWYNLPTSIFPLERLNGPSNAAVVVIAGMDDIKKHLSLLERIIQSVGCNLEKDTAYLGVWEGEFVPVLNPAEPLEYTKILCFGVPPGQVGCPEIPGDQIRFYEKLTVLFGPGLSELNSNPESKRQIWNSLKIVFNIP